MSTYVILLGPPGSGKGTQAVRLAEALGLAHISTGDLFRAMRSDDTPLARRVQEIMARGDLVPDDVVLEMVTERLARPDCAKGVILDGFPRTIAQADALNAMLTEQFNGRVTVALQLKVSEAEVVARIKGRAEKENRPDDTEEVARERFRVYQEQTAPLIDYYQTRGLLEVIDGERPIDAITPDLLAAIRRRQAGGQS
ncbi:MAG: adenylate kinase [Anaerolineae bacterium]